MDANTSPATVDEDFGAGGFQVVLVYFQFHRRVYLFRVWGFLFLVKKNCYSISDFIELQKIEF
jgi:hypothetical protein